MIIGNVFLKDDHLVLKDVDGSEIELPAVDALYLEARLREFHMQLLEIARRQDTKKRAARRGIDASQEKP